MPNTVGYRGCLPEIVLSVVLIPKFYLIFPLVLLGCDPVAIEYGDDTSAPDVDTETTPSDDTGCELQTFWLDGDGDGFGLSLIHI